MSYLKPIASEPKSFEEMRAIIDVEKAAIHFRVQDILDKLGTKHHDKELVLSRAFTLLAVAEKRDDEDKSEFYKTSKPGTLFLAAIETVRQLWKEPFVCAAEAQEGTICRCFCPIVGPFCHMQECVTLKTLFGCGESGTDVLSPEFIKALYIFKDAFSVSAISTLVNKEIQIYINAFSYSLIIDGRWHKPQIARLLGSIQAVIQNHLQEKREFEKLKPVYYPIILLGAIAAVRVAFPGNCFCTADKPVCQGNCTHVTEYCKGVSESDYPEIRDALLHTTYNTANPQVIAAIRQDAHQKRAQDECKEKLL